MNSAYWSNTVWMWSCWREASAFQQASRAVAATQKKLLFEMLAKNAASDYGKCHDFSSIRTIDRFQQQVPLATFDTYASAVARIARGESHVLTTEAVDLLEPTSGGRQGEKLVPYTHSLRGQFQRAISTWIYDVMRQCPAIRRGRAYWSISPALQAARTTAGGIPIGFDSDAAYLGRIQQQLIRCILVMPSTITHLRVQENFQYCTLLHLLSAPDLTLISVWSPTYLTSLLAPLDVWSARLCQDLRDGMASLPAPGDANESSPVCQVRCNSDRARSTQKILCSDAPLADKVQALWPRLSLISCWTDGSSANYLGQLRDLFPRVPIQPKGLLATEACVSIPMWGEAGAALALRSHFFEFIPTEGAADASGGPRLAHQLERGGRYRVVVTTGGGLYRYQLGDVIDVVGFKAQNPLVRFMGRADRVCDLVGEKLEDAHVADVLSRAFATHACAPNFSLLVPQSGAPAGYRLYIETTVGQHKASVWSAVEQAVECGLRDNPYYRHAIQVGQLRTVKICVAETNQPQFWKIYEQTCLKRGQSLGNIKPVALDSWSGWASVFDAARNPNDRPKNTFAE